MNNHGRLITVDELVEIMRNPNEAAASLGQRLGRTEQAIADWRSDIRAVIWVKPTINESKRRNPHSTTIHKIREALERVCLP